MPSQTKTDNVGARRQPAAADISPERPHNDHYPAPTALAQSWGQMVGA